MKCVSSYVFCRLLILTFFCATVAVPLKVSWARQEVSSPTAVDIADLHPAFKVTPEQASRALREGQDMAKRGKNDHDLMNKWRHEVKVTHGNKATASGYVWCYGIEGNVIAREGLRAARLYENPAVSDVVLSQGGNLKTITFEVLLTSHPKIGETKRAKFGRILSGLGGSSTSYRNNVVLANADASEVKVIKFVLSDDKNNNYEAINQGSTDESGTTEFYGARPESATVRGTSNSTAYGSASGSGGSASGNVSSYGTSTYTLTQYVPYSQESPYYQARYIVDFPLFDANGKPRIKADAKEIILHIITETGDLAVSYKLTQAKN